MTRPGSPTAAELRRLAGSAVTLARYENSAGHDALLLRCAEALQLLAAEKEPAAAEEVELLVELATTALLGTLHDLGVEHSWAEIDRAFKRRLLELLERRRFGVAT